MSKIISDTIQGRSKDPNVNAGLTVAGVTTATGVVNASSDVRISGNINAGIATFTSIAGDGSALTGVANTDFVVSTATTTARLTVNNDANIIGVSTFTGTTTLGQVTLGIGKSINFDNVQKAFIQEHAVGLGTTTTAGRDAGVGTAKGAIIFNSTTNFVQVYNGDSWDNMSNKFDASGGTKVTPGNGYSYHVFTSPGNFVVNPGPSGNIDILVVAGGGGGGGGADSTWFPGSGGGAGGIAYGTNKPIDAGTYAVAVGSGGAGGAGAPAAGPGATGSTGNNSSFGSPGTGVLGQPDYVLAKGGGGGGWGAPPGSPSNPSPTMGGGSGGGAPSGHAPSGTASQPGTNPALTDYGNPGGINPNASGHSFGGGGAGGTGQGSGPGPFGAVPSGVGGAGQPFPAFASPDVGPGMPSPLQSAFNTAVGPTGLYGGGGGGGATNHPSPTTAGPGEGGTGGGGDGGPSGGDAPSDFNGVSGTGGGGGGGGTQYAVGGRGAATGGPGIVVIRYTS